MLPKPVHLGPEYGAQFQDSSMVSAYRYRPPYPAETFALLIGLISDEPRAVLDVGCGDGAIARHLVERVERIDALDPSAAMIAQGRRLPNGNHPSLNWIVGYAEDAPLQPPYALITAGASLHWMEWQIVLPRFRQLLSPHGVLAIISDGWLPPPWEALLGQICRRYSTNRDYQPYDIVEEIEKRHLFQRVGEQQTIPLPFTQSLDAYIESFHARNGFSRQRMSQAAAAAFDDAVYALVAPACPDGLVTLQVFARLVWGQPLIGQ